MSAYIVAGGVYVNCKRKHLAQVDKIFKIFRVFTISKRFKI